MLESIALIHTKKINDFLKQSNDKYFSASHDDLRTNLRQVGAMSRNRRAQVGRRRLTRNDLRLSTSTAPMFAAFARHNVEGKQPCPLDPVFPKLGNAFLFHLKARPLTNPSHETGK
jgi:hypothetical protein